MDVFELHHGHIQNLNRCSLLEHTFYMEYESTRTWWHLSFHIELYSVMAV